MKDHADWDTGEHAFVSEPMTFSDKVDLIVAAIAKCLAEVGTIERSARNDFHNYKYSTLDDYVSAIRVPMRENGLVAISSVANLDMISSGGETGQPARKPSRRATVRMYLRMVHTSGQWVQIVIAGEGVDSGDGDKAVFKAVTGARKYGLACMLNLSTGDDPERTNGGGGSDARTRPTSQPEGKETKPPVTSDRKQLIASARAAYARLTTPQLASVRKQLGLADAARLPDQTDDVLRKFIDLAKTAADQG